MVKNKVFNNARWIISCKIVQSVLALIINSLVSRYLGPTHYGTIQYAASLVAFVTPFMQVGLNSILVNEIIKFPNKEGETLGTALGMSLTSAFFCVIGMLSFVLVVNHGDKETISVCALYSVSLFFSALEMIQYWFQAKLKSKNVSLVMLAAYIVVSIYRVIILILGKSIYWFALANALDLFIIAISLVIIYLYTGGQHLKFSLKRLKELFLQSRYFIISTLMITIFSQTDKIMLKNMIDAAENGIYSAAVSCSLLSSFVFVAIMDSARPSILTSKRDDSQDYEKKILLLYSIVFYLSLAQCVFMTIFAPICINILYGNEFAAAVTVLRVSVWYTTFSYIGAARSIWILAENKQKYLWVINSSGALCNVLLNLLLIPKFGATGAAVASLISQFFVNVLIGYIILPIRYSNVLLIKSMNPRWVFEYIKNIKSDRG